MLKVGDSDFMCHLKRFIQATKNPIIVGLRFIYYVHKMFLESNRVKGRRILGVWDYKSLPLSVGDPLIFIEYLAVLSIEESAEAIDICVVYDPEDPLGKRGWGGADDSMWGASIDSAGSVGVTNPKYDLKRFVG